VDFYSNRYVGVNLDNPSFAGIARSFGCEGVTVEQLADVVRARAAVRGAEAGQDHGASEDDGDAGIG